MKSPANPKACGPTTYYDHLREYVTNFLEKLVM